jgi:hypothetical protein
MPPQSSTSGRKRRFLGYGALDVLLTDLVRGCCAGVTHDLATLRPTTARRRA